MAGGTAHSEQSYCIPFWPQDLPQRDEWVPSLLFSEYLWREHICICLKLHVVTRMYGDMEHFHFAVSAAFCRWCHCRPCSYFTLVDGFLNRSLPSRCTFSRLFFWGVERRWSKRFETQWEGGGSLTFIGGNECSASVMMIVMIIWWYVMMLMLRMIMMVMSDEW